MDIEELKSLAATLRCVTGYQEHSGDSNEDTLETINYVANRLDYLAVELLNDKAAVMTEIAELERNATSTNNVESPCAHGHECAQRPQTVRAPVPALDTCPPVQTQ